jgi:hypothetical protein
MAVLVEAISVIIRAEAVLKAFKGDWQAFTDIVPNNTLCADDELVRVGFTNPTDVGRFIDTLVAHGLSFAEGRSSPDIAVADQIRGFTRSCPWAEFGHISLDDDPKQRVAACRLAGSDLMQIITPPGWTHEDSLTRSHLFIPNEAVSRLKFETDANGLEVLKSPLSETPFYTGRVKAYFDAVSKPPKRSFFDCLFGRG